MTTMTSEDLQHLLVRSLTAAGFSQQGAVALARQTVFSEELGQHTVGIAHVFDYIDGLAAGRIDGTAEPVMSDPAPTMIQVDCGGGLPQVGFDMAFDRLVSQAKELGMCALLQKNATTCGSLGTFALRLSEAGLVCLAATNGPPLLAGSGSARPVFCTNPMAFSAPQADGPPLLIDQSSSATAYVNVREAAGRDEAIPTGWALDKDGKPTTDPKAALTGALLAYGGARGANMALMVEVLAAGLTGANWSLDAPSAFDGDRCPATGLFVLAIDPLVCAPDFRQRMAAQTHRLQDDYNVHIPGLSKSAFREKNRRDGIDVDDDMIERLRALAAG